MRVGAALGSTKDVPGSQRQRHALITSGTDRGLIKIQAKPSLVVVINLVLPLVVRDSVPTSPITPIASVSTSPPPTSD